MTCRYKIDSGTPQQASIMQHGWIDEKSKQCQIHVWRLHFRGLAMVLSEHLPRPGIQSPDLPALNLKVLSIWLNKIDPLPDLLTTALYEWVKSFEKYIIIIWSVHIHYNVNKDILLHYSFYCATIIVLIAFN